MSDSKERTIRSINLYRFFRKVLWYSRFEIEEYHALLIGCAFVLIYCFSGKVILPLDSQIRFQLVKVADANSNPLVK